MAISKPKPIKTSRRRMLVDTVDARSRGDSNATRTRRITISTTDDIAQAVEDAAYERHVSRSRLIEAALVEYLGL